MNHHWKKRAIKIILIQLLIIVAISCNKISNETDPAKIILGKWELIEMGNWPVMYPTGDPYGYMEYRPDSIKIEYIYNPPESYQLNFWIDSLLHERVYLQEEHRYVLTTRYKFEFFDRNQKMRLDFASGIAEYGTSIYKRKN
jgi:hypothetical protein